MSFDLQIIDGDIKLSADGTIKTLTDTPKLRQDILKIIVTSLGSNRFHPWYGCPISDTAVGSAYPDNLLFTDIETSIKQSLERLRTLQMAQSSGQRVSLSEMISRVEGVEVERDLVDPRQINIRVSVLARNLSLVEEVFTIVS